MEAVFGRVETIAVADKTVSILLIKNPAGANEVLRTLLLEADASANGHGLDLWIALNDRIADGRDVSWVWDADFELLAGQVRHVACAGTRAAEMAVRLKYAGAAAGGDHGRPRRSSAPSIARSPRPTARCSPCPRTRRCSSSAPCSRREGSRRGIGRELGGQGGRLARGRVRRLRRGPPRLGAAGGRRHRARPGAGLRDGPRRPPPGRSATTRSGLSMPTPPCSRRSRRRRARRGSLADRVRRRSRPGPRPRVRADPGPDAAPPDARARHPHATRLWSGRRATSRLGAASRRRSSQPVSTSQDGSARPRSRTSGSSTAGSTRAFRSLASPPPGTSRSTGTGRRCRPTAP